MENNQHSKRNPDVVEVLDAVESPQSTEHAAPAKAQGILGMAQDWWQKNGGPLKDLAGATKDSAAEAGQRAKTYAQKEPVKAMAIAAAAGMVVSAVMSARARNKAANTKAD